MIEFPLTRYTAFRKQFNPDAGLRLGQAFHTYMQLDKCVQDKAFCDRLYNADETTARRMIESRLNREV